MENLKLNILAIAICSALGLSACGNDANVSNNLEVKKENVKQTQLQTEIEQKVTEMAKANIVQRLIGNDNSFEIQKYVFETFPKNNIRMEPTLENYKWYAERQLVPPFIAKKTDKEIKAMASNETVYKEKLNKIHNEVFNMEKPNPRTTALIKDLFFLDDGSFLLYDNSIETAGARLLAFDTFQFTLPTELLNFIRVDDNGNFSKEYQDYLNYIYYHPDRLKWKHAEISRDIIAYAEKFILKKKEGK